MSNTIEKALKRKQQAMEQKAKEDAEQQASILRQSTLEKASEKNQTIEEQVKVSTEENSTVHTPESDTSVVSDSSAGASVDETGKSNVQNEENNQNFLNIDLDEMETRGFVSMSGARVLINEEYREIKRKLLRNAFGPLAKTLNNANIIMVTSARPGEGKTFTAVNLALTIAAEQDKTVLLVDADVLRPNVLRTLKCKADNGLMEHLLGEVDDLSDVIYKTNVDKLRIIPAGKSHHLSTELLASQKMSDTVNEFSTRYSDRIVIIDTPPIIGINESAVLANFAGQAVVVCEEGKSNLNDIRNAVIRLNEDMAVGFVVNKSVNSSSDGAGYYGYYYASERD